MKKTLMFVLAVLSATPHAYAQLEIKPATQLVQRLREKFPDYFDSIMSDPRFGFFDMRVITKPVAREENPPEIIPRRKIKVASYGYVTNRWSRTEGTRFLETNAEVLARAENQLKVSKEATAAIFDIETQFGKIKGDYLVFKTFFTIAVFKPNIVSKGWAEKELLVFLTICKQNHWDPLSIKGSRRGAFATKSSATTGSAP